VNGNPIEILLVEDNLGDIRLTTEAFKEGRLLNNITVMRDGVEALLYLRSQGKYSDAKRPDLILLDLNLPKKDGRAVLADIKADQDLMHIPVIILTTSEAEQDILRSYQLHANCYITKPVDMEQFMKVIRYVEGYWFSIVRLPPK
jgi:two-component system, chemotaxis family, response regulator Rcp1